MRHPNAAKGPTAVIRSIEAGIQHIDFVGIFRISINTRVIPRALAQISLLVGLGPGAAAVIRSEHAAVVSLDNGPQPIGVRGRDGYPDNSDRPARQSWATSYLSPRVAAVSRFEDAAARAPTLQRPGLSIDFPESCVQNIRICRIDNQIASAGFVTAKQNLLPGLAAVL